MDNNIFCPNYMRKPSEISISPIKKPESQHSKFRKINKLDKDTLYSNNALSNNFSKRPKVTI